MTEPATPEQVRALLAHVEDEIIRRVLETQASLDEIVEALHTIDDDGVPDEPPLSSRVARVRAILCELVGDECAEFGAVSISI